MSIALGFARHLTHNERLADIFQRSIDCINQHLHSNGLCRAGEPPSWLPVLPLNHCNTINPLLVESV